VFTTAPTCPYLRQINPAHAPHPISYRPKLILNLYLCLGLPIGLFPPGLPTITLYTPLLSPIRATCPTYLVILDLMLRVIFGEEHRLVTVYKGETVISLVQEDNIKRKIVLSIM
jgi:hypothetical protein